MRWARAETGRNSVSPARCRGRWLEGGSWSRAARRRRIVRDRIYCRWPRATIRGREFLTHDEHSDRHRRRRLHRLQLRPPRPRARRQAPGRGPRQAHLRRQPREPRRRRRPPALRLRPGRHRRPRRGAARCSPSTGPTAVVNFAAESHVDRSIDEPGAFVRDQHRRHLRAARGGPRVLRVSWVADAAARASASSTSRPTRSTARLGDDRAVLARTRPTRRTRPTPPRRPPPTTWCAPTHETYGLPALITNCSNNYGPYQFPEKLIPLMILNAARGQAAADLRRRRQRARLALRRGPLRAASCRRSSAAGPGEKYNLGGGNERTNLQIVDALCRLLESGGPAPANPALAERGLASLRRAQDLRRRPARATTAATPSTPRKAAARARLGSRGTTSRAACAATVRWYLDNRDWCEAVQSGKYRRERLGPGASA